MSQAKISGPILQTTGPNEPETIILIFFYVHVLETVMQCKAIWGNLGRYGLNGEREISSIPLWALKKNCKWACKTVNPRIMFRVNQAKAAETAMNFGKNKTTQYKCLPINPINDKPRLWRTWCNNHSTSTKNTLSLPHHIVPNLLPFFFPNFFHSSLNFAFIGHFIS